MAARRTRRKKSTYFAPSHTAMIDVIFILFVFFFVVGVSYGFGSGSIRSTHEIPRLMARGLSGVAGFLVVCIPAAVFIDLLHKSNLTTIIAIEVDDFGSGRASVVALQRINPDRLKIDRRHVARLDGRLQVGVPLFG